MQEKRKRARAIVLLNNKLVAMYRELQDRVFYAFPGGGMEGTESEEECVVREVFEEFGLNVKPIKKVYIYESERSVESFYLCEYISGEFGSGKGEEFEANNPNGLYKPVLLDIQDIPTLPLMPNEVSVAFYNDYIKYGPSLREEIKIV